MSGFTWRDHDGLRFLAAELPGAGAAFSTRLGGVSADPYASLNLGSAVADEPVAVRENRARLAAALGLEDERIGFAHQVHGKTLVDADQALGKWLEPDPNHLAGTAEADGQIVRRSGDAGLVFVADCVPIVVAGERGVAVLHGGWRGLAAGIVADGVAAVDGIAAAVGPSIGPCCYEVGDEVTAAFSALGPGFFDGPNLNLWAAAEALLRRAGVQEVISARLCTRCNPDLFFSHRGQGPRTGRQAGLGWMEGRDG